jgi:hypothetical protein
MIGALALVAGVTFLVAGVTFTFVWSAVAVGWAMSDAIGTTLDVPIGRIMKANPVYWLTLWLWTER